MNLFAPERLAGLLERFDASPDFQRSVGHNLGTLRRIRGGLRLAEAVPTAFDPRDDYWRRPERRLIVAWLGANWTDHLAPVTALRTLALHLFRHFDRIDEGESAPFRGVDYARAPGGWTGVIDRLNRHLDRMTPPDPALWDAVARTWPSRTAPSLRDALAAYLDWAREDEARWNASEVRFRYRVPWFPYLGASTLEQVARNQAFWFGFLNLWTGSNAYRRAGSQSFSPVIQNTPVQDMVAVASAWGRGESTAEAPFLGIGIDDLEASDRSRWSAVVEVYGFLNLHRGPFYNTAVADALVDGLGGAQAGRPDPYTVMREVGAITRDVVRSDAQLARRLAGALEAWQKRWPALTGFDVPLEWQPGKQGLTRAGQEPDAVIDAALRPRIRRLADETIAAHDTEERACIALHLLLDAALGQDRGIVPPRETPAEPSVASPRDADPAPPMVQERPAATWPDERPLRLPDALRPTAERALAYLRAGFHVLLAGVPGTGKTTIAQFVAHAWNEQLARVPHAISRRQLPRTTVGNSAWSPFHTIGGIVPTGQRDAFTVAPGVFIDRASLGDAVWQLFPGAMVLDEMNRADLDRCIGELYPLLSDSVHEVWPAGIPGMERIVGHPRFRIVATINDSTLDDIVFPISEGLARRFQRIEVEGAEQQDVDAYVLGEETSETERSPRGDAAVAAVRRLYTAARDAGLSDRLPIGVGWFRPLRAWVDASLVLDGEAVAGDLAAEALFVLVNALRPANAHGIRDLLSGLGRVE